MGSNEGPRLALFTCGAIVLVVAWGVAYALSSGAARDHLGTLACLVVGPVVFAAREELAGANAGGRREGIAYRVGYAYAVVVGVTLFGAGVARLVVTVVDIL